MTRRLFILGGHARRVLPMAPSPSRTFHLTEHRGEAPQWARASRALPRSARGVGEVL